MADLILATEAHEVDSICFLRNEPATGCMRFEVGAPGADSQYGRTNGFVRELGTLVDIEEGSLYDSRGRPMNTADWERGVRLTVIVKSPL